MFSEPGWNRTGKEGMGKEWGPGKIFLTAWQRSIRQEGFLGEQKVEYITHHMGTTWTCGLLV